MSGADAAEGLQALAQAGWTITLWHEAPRARLGPLAAKGPTFVVEAGGVTGYDDDQAGEGATLAEAVSALVDRLREAYPDDDAPEEHTTQGAPLAAVARLIVALEGTEHLSDDQAAALAGLFRSGSGVGQGHERP